MGALSIADEIDFSLYRKPELAEKVGSLLSLPGVLRTIARCGAAVVLATWILLLFFCATADSGQLSLKVFLCLYGTIAASVCGSALGCLVALNRALDHLLDVFDLTLEVAAQATRDAAELRQGEKKMPGAGQMLVGVHDHVLLPIVKGVVQGQSRWLAWLIFPIYRWSLHRLLWRVVRYVEREQPDLPSEDTADFADNEPQLQMAAAATGAEIARSSTEHWSPFPSLNEGETAAVLDRASLAMANATAWIIGARRYVAAIGHGFRIAIVTPLSLLLGAGTAAALALAILVWLAAS